jgi:hypothetical protein
MTESSNTTPSPLMSRLQARRLSMETLPSSRLQIRRSSFTERVPTPIPPFVAPDVDVPEKMMYESMQKYRYLPTNTPENSPRPGTPIPTEETLNSKGQVFHMLNQSAEGMHERDQRNILDGHDNDMFNYTTPINSVSGGASRNMARRHSSVNTSSLHRFAMLNAKSSTPLVAKK